MINKKPLQNCVHATFDQDAGLTLQLPYILDLPGQL